MSTALKEAAAEIRRDIEAAVAEVKAHPRMADIMTAVKALNGLEEMLKEPRTALGEFFGFASAEGTKPAESLPAVRFDAFIGQEPLDAAKNYLKTRGEAREFQEIVDAIRSGGAKVDSEEKLRGQLNRSTLEVVKIGERYGLLDHYPQVKAQRWKNVGKQAPAQAAATSEKSAGVEQPTDASEEAGQK